MARTSHTLDSDAGDGDVSSVEAGPFFCRDAYSFKRLETNAQEGHGGLDIKSPNRSEDPKSLFFKPKAMPILLPVSFCPWEHWKYAG